MIDHDPGAELSHCHTRSSLALSLVPILVPYPMTAVTSSRAAILSGLRWVMAWQACDWSFWNRNL